MEENGIDDMRGTTLSDKGLAPQKKETQDNGNFYKTLKYITGKLWDKLSTESDDSSKFEQSEANFNAADGPRG